MLAMGKRAEYRSSGTSCAGSNRYLLAGQGCWRRECSLHSELQRSSCGHRTRTRNEAGVSGGVRFGWFRQALHMS